MYIAFKWLTALAITMWLGLCGFDMYRKGCRKNLTSDFIVKRYEVGLKYINDSNPTKIRLDKKERENWNHLKQNYKQHSMPFLHYVMFLAGACIVLVYNKKNAILEYTKKGVTNINIRKTIKCITVATESINLKESAKRMSVALHMYFHTLWGIARDLVLKLIIHEKSDIVENINLKLLKRVKEIGQDRKTLGRLLLAAIDENKNIRQQFQLETKAKNRLVRYIEDTQKLIKENRTRYVSFQQLYLVTHRENIFLKIRIKKLTDEKDAAERNLMELINEVYRTPNNSALKAYCTRFIVRTKKNLLNSDVRAEIQEFLQKSRVRSAVSNQQMADQLGFKLCGTCSLPECSCRITDVSRDDESLTNLVLDAPKLRGLPGECVWTVKDKNGLIEKLYEYNYETDHDNGDTIRRIREYSVYHDKDCLLDQTNLQPSVPACPSTSVSATRLRLDINPLASLAHTSKGFLTGSKEFKFFLRNTAHNNTSSQVTPLPYA